LLAEGLSHSAVHKRVARGVLYRKYPGVYVLGHPELSREGEWMAAVLAIGEDAALSHLSVAVFWGTWRYRVAIPDVLVPRRHRPVEGINVHSCRRLDPLDVVVYRGIRVTTVARMLVDLSDVLTAEELANVIHEAAFRERFSLTATRQAMARANGRHNLAVLEAALAMYLKGSAGVKSRLERAFRALVKSAGLPAPLVNTGVEGIEVDFHWPDRKLIVEIDGPGHARPRSKREDALCERILRAAGYRTLRFSEEDIERRPELVLARLGAGA
jgi:hypothetical protein